MRSGITRAEVVVFLLLIAVAIAVGIPFVLHSREAARRATCTANLKQFGTALENYHKVSNAFPYGSVGDPGFPPENRWSWLIGPASTFLPGRPQVVPVDFSMPSNDPDNLPATFVFKQKDGSQITLPTRNRFPCPSGERERDAAGQILATYVSMAGIGKDAATLPVKHKRSGVWGYDRQTAIDDIGDGLEKTISLIETAHDRGSWYRSGPATVRGVDPDHKNVIGDDGQFGGFHEGQAIALYADGSVRYLSSRIDAKVFEALSTIADAQQKAEPAP